MRELIKIIPSQTRFESWAQEDQPVVISPKTFSVGEFQAEDIEGLADIYQRAFNSQNQRLYRETIGARLIWDEEPWTIESAKNQLEEELSAPSSVCLVARAKTPEGLTKPIGLIVARPVSPTQLITVCGSEEIAENIFSILENQPTALLWEDAATLNLIIENGETIRGVGTSLYQIMASIADSLKVNSIGRTSPGSYAEKILPKVGFKTAQPPIQDGKDKQRYWLIRQYEK